MSKKDELEVLMKAHAQEVGEEQAAKDFTELSKKAAPKTKAKKEPKEQPTVERRGSSALGRFSV